MIYDDEDIRQCAECKKEVNRADLIWVKDRYGIPFKLVCDDCYETVQEAIEEWEFDPDYAGERLECDY